VIRRGCQPHPFWIKTLIDTERVRLAPVAAAARGGVAGAPTAPSIARPPWAGAPARRLSARLCLPGDHFPRLCLPGGVANRDKTVVIMVAS
jgi:hypothetical protein